MLGFVPKSGFMWFLREKLYKKQTRYANNVIETNTGSEKSWMLFQFKRPPNFTEADDRNFGPTLQSNNKVMEDWVVDSDGINIKKDNERAISPIIKWSSYMNYREEDEPISPRRHK